MNLLIELSGNWKNYLSEQMNLLMRLKEENAMNEGKLSHEVYAKKKEIKMLNHCRKDLEETREAMLEEKKEREDGI